MPRHTLLQLRLIRAATLQTADVAKDFHKLSKEIPAYKPVTAALQQAIYSVARSYNFAHLKTIYKAPYRLLYIPASALDPSAKVSMADAIKHLEIIASELKNKDTLDLYHALQRAVYRLKCATWAVRKDSSSHMQG